MDDKIIDLFKKKSGKKITHREIASELNVSISTVKRFISKAASRGDLTVVTDEGRGIFIKLSECDSQIKKINQGHFETTRSDKKIDLGYLFLRLEIIFLSLISVSITAIIAISIKGQVTNFTTISIFIVCEFLSFYLSALSAINKNILTICSCFAISFLTTLIIYSSSVSNYDSDISRSRKISEQIINLESRIELIDKKIYEYVSRGWRSQATKLEQSRDDYLKLLDELKNEQMSEKIKTKHDIMYTILIRIVMSIINIFCVRRVSACAYKLIKKRNSL